MSSYHILSGDKNANRFLVIYHIPVPDVLNQAGVSYQTALAEYLDPIESIVPNISAQELGQLQAGQLLEVPHEFNTNPLETLAQKRDRLDAIFATLGAEKQSELSKILSYWGFERII